MVALNAAEVDVLIKARHDIPDLLELGPEYRVMLSLVCKRLAVIDISSGEDGNTVTRLLLSPQGQAEARKWEARRTAQTASRAGGLGA